MSSVTSRIIWKEFIILTRNQNIFREKMVVLSEYPYQGDKYSWLSGLVWILHLRCYMHNNVCQVKSYTLYCLFWRVMEMFLQFDRNKLSIFSSLPHLYSPKYVSQALMTVKMVMWYYITLNNTFRCMHIE